MNDISLVVLMLDMFHLSTGEHQVIEDEPNESFWKRSMRDRLLHDCAIWPRLGDPSCQMSDIAMRRCFSYSLRPLVSGKYISQITVTSKVQIQAIAQSPGKHFLRSESHDAGAGADSFTLASL